MSIILLYIFHKKNAEIITKTSNEWYFYLLQIRYTCDTLMQHTCSVAAPDLFFCIYGYISWSCFTALTANCHCFYYLDFCQEALANLHKSVPSGFLLLPLFAEDMLSLLKFRKRWKIKYLLETLSRYWICMTPTILYLRCLNALKDSIWPARKVDVAGLLKMRYKNHSTRIIKSGNGIYKLL